MTATNPAEPHTTALKRTALHAEHAALGAHFTDFGGWDMPLRYGSELAEHRAVRKTAGIFDLSHMGEIWVEGSDAAAFLNTALVGNFAAVAAGRAKYSLLCAEDGGIIDDLICYRLAGNSTAEHRFLVVPNAGNVAVVAAALRQRAVGFDVAVRDVSAETSLVAVQGPKAVAILEGLMDPESRAALDMKYYSAEEARIAGLDVLLARTGYTGEDGFEVYVPNAQASELWRALLAAGEPFALIPAGLASRDSLRLEAGMPLYGNELSLDVNPFEAGLGGVVSFKKPERFVGRAALDAVREAGSGRVLVGLRGAGRRAARAGYTVLSGDEAIGKLTSGLLSPTLEYPIALAYVRPEFAEPGTALDVDLRGKPQPFEVVALPFYTRPA